MITEFNRFFADPSNTKLGIQHITKRKGGSKLPFLIFLEDRLAKAIFNLDFYLNEHIRLGVIFSES